jgi:hypothetical protein
MKALGCDGYYAGMTYRKCLILFNYLQRAWQALLPLLRRLSLRRYEQGTIEAQINVDRRTNYQLSVTEQCLKASLLEMVVMR